MDLHAQLAHIERPAGTGAWVAYAIGLAVGTVVALPILVALFGVELPML
jgi:hypothetical protein